MQNKSEMCKVYTVILLAPQEVSLHAPNEGQAQEAVKLNITQHRQHCPLQPGCHRSPQSQKPGRFQLCCVREGSALSKSFGNRSEWKKLSAQRKLFCFPVNGLLAN